MRCNGKVDLMLQIFREGADCAGESVGGFLLETWVCETIADVRKDEGLEALP